MLMTLAEKGPIAAPPILGEPMQQVMEAARA